MLYFYILIATASFVYFQHQEAELKERRLQREIREMEIREGIRDPGWERFLRQYFNE